MLFLPRRWRIVCFFNRHRVQIGVIVSANSTFLNYLVLVLGFLLLDDRLVRSILPGRWRARLDTNSATVAPTHPAESRIRLLRSWRTVKLCLSMVMLTWIF